LFFLIIVILVELAYFDQKINAYEILDVSKNADKQTIHEAYKKLAKGIRNKSCINKKNNKVYTILQRVSKIQLVFGTMILLEARLLLTNFTKN
jgi:hypothetical protein